MNSIKIIIYLIIGLTILFILFMLSRIITDKKINNITNNESASSTSVKKLFLGGKLSTDFSLHSIPIDKILDGGPGKDGIPALVDPTFTTLAEAEKWLPPHADGLLVTINQMTKFYPFNILVWHEVVNDTINNQPIVVTFCPLCGSAIVFDAQQDNKREYFGVSGKLYESNLLMYDKTTESLWSQIIGEAVVGTKTNTKLKIIPAQVISLATLKNNYPDAKVMSKETGYNRNYTTGPYGDYNDNNDLYFPISINDNRLPTKEIMYITNFEEHSIAWQRNALSESVPATIKVGSSTLTALIINNEIIVKTNDGTTLPGYTAMWFSFAIHHQKDGLVWKK